jgi:glucan phosphoethanolaminetransferase (alkaline phosphatase superfamily)
MDKLFFALVIACILHLILHRLCIHTKWKTTNSLLSYPFLFILLLITPMDFKLTNCIIYCLLSLIISIVYLSQLSLQNITPMATILNALRTNRSLSINTLLDLFSTQDLIDKRLDDLLTSGLIQKQDKDYKLSHLGRLVKSIITIFEFIFVKTGG